MEPEVRHPDCPDVHLGVCSKCRRLYERDRKNAKSSALAKMVVCPEDELPAVAAEFAEEVFAPIKEAGEQALADFKNAVAENEEARTAAEKNRDRVRKFRENMTAEQRMEYRKRDRERKRK